METRYVFIHLPGATEAVPAGRLTMTTDARGAFAAAAFAYGNRYIVRKNALDIDPLSLPRLLSGGRERQPLNGLPMFGAIRDAAPDAWGRRVIENLLRLPGPLPDWQYLDEAGSDRAGALDVRRSLTSEPRESTHARPVDLHYLLEASERIEAGEPVPEQLQHFFTGGPTLGGMRPKAVIDVAGRPFLAKFPSRTDRFDMPAVERATLELAREAGLHVPRTELHELADGRRVLLIERLDRIVAAGRTSRRHMVSALTMLGVDESESSHASYAQIAHVISARAPTNRVVADRAELFGRMVFNILVSNSDDHLRNHAFLSDGTGGWELSPLYDVVPTPSPAYERFLHLHVGEHGRLARVDNAHTHAAQFGLSDKEAAEIADRIYRITRQWRNTFQSCGVSPQDCELIASAFRSADNVGM